jgi:hypothetical protein
LSKAAPRWTADEDARLALQGKGLDGTRAWIDMADAHFPGRSGWACRQRYLLLRKRAAGQSYADLVVQRKATVAARWRREADIVAAATATRQATAHASLTAAFFGDPPIGRSALEARREADCKGFSAPHAPITLPTTPFLPSPGDHHASDH